MWVDFLIFYVGACVGLLLGILLNSLCICAHRNDRD
jgi:hypothetical protein